MDGKTLSGKSETKEWVAIIATHSVFPQIYTTNHILVDKSEVKNVLRRKEIVRNLFKA